MLDQNLSILCWNVRGLNCPDRRATIHETITATPCHIVCLQETKLQNVDPFIASFLGGHRLKSFAQRPSVGTRGGILLLWDEHFVKIQDVNIGAFFLSAKVSLSSSGESFKLTTVYGPTRSNLKDGFFQELVSEKPHPGEKWLVNGDFNQIYRARDKNRANVDQSRIVRFRNALNACELKEIHLQNRKFTWSNERNDPTLSKLDSFFCNEEWDLHFGTHLLHALSSSLSDHCPLLLANDKGPPRTKSFRFENFWIKMPRFKEVVNSAWNQEVNHVDPHHILFHKMKKTSQVLRTWSKTIFAHSKVQIHMALEVILRLDVAQECRPLSAEELDIRRRLKRKVVSLSVLERARKRQCSRITNLKDGDANTRFFHLRVNHRRRKNFIHRLRHNSGWVTEHEHKKSIIQNHFAEITKRGTPRNIDINWDRLELLHAAKRNWTGHMFMEVFVVAVWSIWKERAARPSFGLYSDLSSPSPANFSM
ncbi:uncharacterized protein [Triticum aestivum]|uniref:uncharacterized protein n=1 Tax=Triticum aestivum TaxID=4565 RepID=UPI001D02ED7D|nr:uncharacterized protein LOC123112384 [Triticum aestivum]XP_044389290.1 uncharacterized protein LOC123112384 [Triticum aestivum]XP_044389291.1 uncharacterized protein LOC123112384 [Triticum aestivum]XP_044389292.1 uncharacterized protein LOC123112384 [Triticum aestivum]XP_044389293.1 uncharacterized protein LOC123112384 [Triticum aestivum]XP_044389295.1 uncharacterized protein LOC123112384 [Triticum aestivum]XP_044389296.1 uncharacterized protein LOC123112384 [Triticum aestivum]XP_04438929